MRWRQNPKRVAWIILLTSFFVCCALAVAVPLAARGYVLHATRLQSAQVTVTAGTVQLWASGADDPTAVTGRRAVPEGGKLVTDPIAKGLLTIAADEAGEKVLATIQLLQDTAVTLVEARSPRFTWSRDPEYVDLKLDRGRVILAAQSAGGRAVRLHLRTPQADVSFGSGSYDITVQTGQTQVVVKSGAAEVLATGREVTANGGERVNVTAGLPPDLPVPAALNLVLNGTFEGRLAPIWQEAVKVAAGLEPGKVTQEKVDERQAIRFTRRTEDGAHNEAGVRQVVNRDVQGYDSLVLRIDLRLLYQSVVGGGYLASEYPVMVKISYTDIYGKDLDWVQGFYYLELPKGSTYAQPTGEKIPFAIWYTYESPNLLDLLGDTRPARINAIAIYASGHDYDSLVSDVALNVR